MFIELTLIDYNNIEKQSLVNLDKIDQIIDEGTVCKIQFVSGPSQASRYRISFQELKQIIKFHFSIDNQKTLIPTLKPKCVKQYCQNEKDENSNYCLRCNYVKTW